eukprot:scaffold10402_cov42-Attheya_sp.AAC.1
MVARVQDEHAYVAIDISDFDSDGDSDGEDETYAFYTFLMDSDHAIQVLATRALVENHTTWEEVPLTSAQTKVLPVTWVFKRKRTADDTIKKYKGRLCVRGDLGTEEHNAGETDTHDPVAALPT